MEWITGLIPEILAAAGGFGVAIVSLLPAVRRLRSAIVVLQQTVSRLYPKYANTLTGVMLHDAKTLVRDADAVTEAAGDVIRHVPFLRRYEKMARDLIKREWYADLRY